MSMTYGEFCAGYGGLGLAVEEVFDAELAWYFENDAAPSKIMARHWPDAPNHGDMTTADWATIPSVDILSGGTPCQDLSGAGARKGMTEGTRSNLWVQMRDAIATIRPQYVVWENVRGAYSARANSELELCSGCMGAHGGNGEPVLRALGRVLGDLADLGYDAQWRGLRAADVGAPHGRYRIFILAKRRDTTADRDGVRSDRRREWAGKDWRGQSANSGRALANTEGIRSGEHVEPFFGRVPATTGPGSTGTIDWGPYATAICRWEALRGSAPAPTEAMTDSWEKSKAKRLASTRPVGHRGSISFIVAGPRRRLSARFAEFMMGVDPGWITDTPGISRNDQLKAAGNGVVPSQAAAAIRHMLASSQATQDQETAA